MRRVQHGPARERLRSVSTPTGRVLARGKSADVALQSTFVCLHRIPSPRHGLLNGAHNLNPTSSDNSRSGCSAGLAWRRSPPACPPLFCGRLWRSRRPRPIPVRRGRALLILCSSSNGDPVNANCPGSYEHAAIVHPPGKSRGHSASARRDGDARGALWTQLPPSALNRACFIHHATRTWCTRTCPRCCA